VFSPSLSSPSFRFFVAAPHSFLEQVVAVQLWRPDDGVLGSSGRVFDLFRLGPVGLGPQPARLALAVILAVAAPCAWRPLLDRLPYEPANEKPLVDPLGELLLAARRAGGDFDHSREALQSPAAQTILRRWLESCRFAAPGRQPESEAWSAGTRRWFDLAYDPVVQPESDYLQLWESRPG
jgi:hypothetical protein